MPEFFTAKQVAEKLKLSELTVRRLEKAGKLQGVRIGDSLRFSGEAVEQLLRSCQK